MSGDSAWTSATPLSNADFKALLSTPRPNWSGGGSGGGGGSAQRGAAPQRPGGAAKEARPFKPPKPRPKPTAQQGEEDDGPKYRWAGPGGARARGAAAPRL